MPPREVLDSLWSEVRTERSPLQTALQQPRPRPMPRQMRGADLRALDPNAGVRRQAQRELTMRDAALSDPRTAPRAPVNNQFAEAGAMALEGTGLPAVRRGAANITRGAMNQDPYQGLRQIGGGSLELGLGGLGAAGLGIAPRLTPRPMPAPRAPALPEPTPRMTPPPREIAPNAAPRMERRTIDIPYPEWGRDAGKTFEALQNPTGDQLTRFATQDARGAGWRGPLEGYELRYVRDLDGNVFFVSGYNAEHSATAAGLRARGVNVGEGTRGEGGAGLVTFRDGRWRWSNLNGDALDPIDFQYGRGAPTRPATEIAPNGMPIHPSEPFRNSLRGGSDDLADAAGMRASAASDDASLSYEQRMDARDQRLAAAAAEGFVSPFGREMAFHASTSPWMRSGAAADLGAGEGFGLHVGNRGAAAQAAHGHAPTRTKERPPIYLEHVGVRESGREIQMTDIEDWGSARNWRAAVDDGLIEGLRPEEMTALRQLLASANGRVGPAVNDLLRSFGVRRVRYKNRFERRGDPSLIVLDPSDLRVIRTDGLGSVPDYEAAPSRIRDPSRPNDTPALQAPTLPPSGADPSVRRGIFGPPQRPGVRDMQPDAVQGDRHRRTVIDARDRKGAPNTIIVNPSREDILRMTRVPRGAEAESWRHDTLRYISDADGNVYVANGSEVLHDDMARALRERGLLPSGYQFEAAAYDGHGGAVSTGTLRRSGDKITSNHPMIFERGMFGQANQ